MKPTPSLSVVVPVFNEEANLDELVERSLSACEKTGLPFEIILVDDGSADRSPEKILSAAEHHQGKILGVLLNRNCGQHPAVMAGLRESRGDIVVTLDADLQNPPEEIPRLVGKALEGYDVVGTVRVRRRDSLFRRFFSRLVNRITARATGVEMRDYGCMLRAYSRPVVDAVLQCREQSTFIPVLANSFASRPTEIEVSHSERQAGASKYDLFRLVSLQFDLLSGMTTFPLRLLSFIGVLISIIGVGFGILLLLLRLILGPIWAAQGVFTLFAILFFFVGMQFIAMGLMGEYIGRIYKDVRARPRYIVRSRAGSTALADKKP